MHLDPARVAFGGADDVEVAVAVCVEEDGVFSVRGFAGRYDLPRHATCTAAIGEVDARESTLFPAGDEIQGSVAIGIGCTNAIRAERRRIDRVALPWLSALGDWRTRQTHPGSNGQTHTGSGSSSNSNER